MDLSSGEWLSDLANEDPTTIMHHCQMMMSSIIHDVDFNENFQPSDIVFAANNPTIIKSEDGIESTTNCEAKIKSSTHNSWSTSDGKLISFGSSSKFEENDKNRVKQKQELNNGSKNVGSTCNNEHVAAERLRREKMNQAFVALSALIPGLKKMDKASILTEATKYVKQLEERAKQLEHQQTKRVVESAHLVKNMQKQTMVNHNNYSNSSNKDNNNTIINYRHHQHLLEIEARFLNNNVLIRIHSLKKQGLIKKVLDEIGKLNITTLTCQTMPFGSYAIDITIIGQFNDDFRMTREDVVKHLEDTLTLQHTNIQLP